MLNVNSFKALNHTAFIHLNWKALENKGNLLLVHKNTTLKLQFWPLKLLSKEENFLRKSFCP